MLPLFTSCITCNTLSLTSLSDSLLYPEVSMRGWMNHHHKQFSKFVFKKYLQYHNSMVLFWIQVHLKISCFDKFFLRLWFSFDLLSNLQKSHVIFYILVFSLQLLSPTPLCPHTFPSAPSNMHTWKWELFRMVGFGHSCFFSGREEAGSCDNSV